MNNKILLIVTAALLALTVIFTGILLVKTTGTAANSPAGQIVNTISVSSTGKVTVLPDVGYISLGIETKDPDVKIAEDDNSEIMDAIMSALAKFDIEETDIETVGYNIYPQYEEYNDEKPSTYVVSNTIEVTVKNLEDMSKIIDAAVEAGANRTNSIRFDVLDREASYNEALKDAVEKAKARAEVLAEASGLKIVGVLTVSESGSMPSYYYADTMTYAMAEDAKASSVSISTGDLDISASVSVTFEVTQK